MINKITVLILLFFQVLITVDAQITAEKWIATSQDEYVESMTYLYGDILFLVTARGKKPENYQQKFTNYSNRIYKSDFSLEFSDSLYLDEIDNYDVLVKDFLQVDNTGIMFWGKALEKDTEDEQLCILWFDEDLNLVSSSIFGITDTMEVISDAIKCSNGNILFAGSTTIDALQPGNYFLWEFDSDMNEIKKVLFDQPVSNDSPSIIEIAGTERYHFCAGFYTYQFDYELNQEAVYEFPNNISLHPQSQNKAVNDFDYLKTCLYMTAPVPGSPWELDMAFAVMDENANVLNTYTFGIQDSIETPGKLDFITPDTIYFAGTRNLKMNPVQDSWVSLFLTNLQGEVLNHRFWGGGGQYSFSDLTALPEGGFLLAMTKWDYVNYPDTITRDIFFVTENYGNPVTGISGETTNIKLYPNPGGERLYISTGKNNCIVKLYGQNSNILLDKRFDKNTIISTAGLQKGLYFYEIKENNRIVSRGKWVKIDD